MMLLAKGMLLVTLVSQAAPIFGAIFERTVVHKQVAMPERWTAAPITARDDALMILQIGLVRRNIDDLESVLKDFSTPGSEKYGQHLDKDEVDEQF